MSCAYYSEQRRRCHDVYGKFGEDCLAEELQEKRCLSLRHCRADANKYYGSRVEGLPKALCSSWAESFAFVNNSNGDLREMSLGKEFVEHHANARRYVNERPSVKKECQTIARDLARCLQKANMTRR
ncbi:expressed unknown protein [Seminavis robusta]|uniref:Uncharacterized protein n=1 Tax=Seminavis robusta TaxID=568900 RepID=A0A9N8DKA0_9STRA|nr:expressed unknown protein [Seminavis robusta]|eukprot:Sro132_g062590.1 n/a (127) ;mRNA; f:55524-55904